MSVWKAWNAGWRRVLRAPGLIVGTWLATLAVALPLTLVLHEQLAEHLGASLAAGSATSGVNLDWWNEFLAQTGALGQTFVPSVIGFAAVLNNLSTLADMRPQSLVILAAVSVHIGLSVFLAGGILDRLARDRSLGSHGFVAACGGYLSRLLRLAVLAGFVYWMLFAWLHALLFERVYEALTHQVTVERTAFMYRTALYVVFGAILGLVNLFADYAKIRLVVEDRRSAVGAVAAAVRFVARHPRATVGLYLLNTASFLVVLAVYAAVSPGAAGGAWAVLALTLGQIFIVLRVGVRLTFVASQIALFQSRLAHAGYTAAPLPAWPDSPAAEAIRPD